MPSLIISYKTNEIINHNESQVISKKPESINEFKNKIIQAIQKYFGKVYAENKSSSEKNNSEEVYHTQIFRNKQIIINISEKVKHRTSNSSPCFLNDILTDNNIENVKYSTTLKIKTPKQNILYLRSSEGVLKSLDEILEFQKQNDKDATITYKLGLF